MRRLFMTAAALVLLIAGLVILVAPEHQASPPAPRGPSPEARSTATAGEPQLAMSPGVHAATSSERDIASGSADAAPGDPHVRATAERMRDRLEAAFAAAGDEEPATRELAQALSSALPGLLPDGSQLRSLRCRGGMCRIETSHASNDRYEEFLTRAFGRDAPRLGLGGVFAGPLGSAPAVPLVTVAFVSAVGRQLIPGAGS